VYVCVCVCVRVRVYIFVYGCVRNVFVWAGLYMATTFSRVVSSMYVCGCGCVGVEVWRCVFMYTY